MTQQLTHQPADRLTHPLAHQVTAAGRPAPPAAVPAVPAAPPDTPDLAALADLRAVLERAAAIVRRGWVQDAYFLVRTRHGRIRPVGPLDLGVPRHAEVTAACLVGAVVHAGRERHPGARGPDHYPALDATWQALRQLHPGAGRGPGGPEPVTHPAARARRVRDLTTWNDTPGRSRAEVAYLLDAAVGATILRSVSPATAATRVG